ncbi:hypothetical protein K440DRAFT_95139 [Wilcoxina mikolae CBS 423.85]|nr:hypothetical protein K440DRAFT_95139 [Wilcoxina mikolae CBS 423.85]
MPDIKNPGCHGEVSLSETSSKPRLASPALHMMYMYVVYLFIYLFVYMHQSLPPTSHSQFP